MLYVYPLKGIYSRYRRNQAWLTCWPPIDHIRRQHKFDTPGGTRVKPTHKPIGYPQPIDSDLQKMSTSGPLTDVSTANTVNSTPKIDELTPEQRRMLEEQMEAYKAVALQCFQKTLHGSVIQKDELPSVTAFP